MENKFSIERPIVFLNVDTTGNDPKKDKIISVSLNKIYPDGRKEKGQKLVNPEMEVPSSVLSDTGLSQEQLNAERPFFQMAEDIRSFISGCDLGGFQIEKDLMFLMEELYNCGINLVLYNTKVIDLYRMYKMLHPRTLLNAYKDYVDPRSNKEKPLDGVERTDMCIDVLNNMLDRTEGLYLNQDIGTSDSGLVQITTSIDDIDRTFYPEQLDLKGWFAKNKEGKVVFNKGKFEGKLAADVFSSNYGYYKEFIDKSSIEEVPRDARYLAEQIMKKSKEASKN